MHVEITNKEGNFPEGMMNKHKISIMESLQREKQIVVDPLSLKESPIEQGYFEPPTMLQTIITTSAATTILHPPPLQPPNPKFLSLSLPNSANSSPRFTLALSKKKSKGESQESQWLASNLTPKNHNQHDPLEEVYLRKSKSCDERRSLAPSYELDQWLSKLSAVNHDRRHHGTVKGSPKSVKKHNETQDDGFRCNALCMYLPGFGGKVRPVKARKEETQREAVMISRTVSLENFECGSWASAAIFHEIEGHSTSSYFDLPMELIKCSANEVHSPLGASFAFEKELKGVLKNGSSRASARKSDASPRHVRFSTSPSASCPASPGFCISPRLRKAREDFNAFLAAAQSA